MEAQGNAWEGNDGIGRTRFRPHPHRGMLLGEIHARPFQELRLPRRLLHFAFATSDAGKAEDRANLAEFCRQQGVSGPAVDSFHYHIALSSHALRWEEHGEFTSYCWSFDGNDPKVFEIPAVNLARQMHALPQPGPLIVSVDFHARSSARPPAASDLAETALCAMTAEEGLAFVATDFRADGDGFVKMELIDNGLSPQRAGALVQRLLELETYRILALLGLPEAHRLAPSVRRIEEDLVAITREMTKAATLEDNEALLDRLAALAAELEAGAAESLFRFGASRAYHSIVQGRIVACRLEPVPERENFAGFLSRRMSPALQTCAAIEERQINLSRKLARATQLLRAKVDVGMERQNREILSTLSQRARTQLRLQRTVEGLSIAAISYYVIGLLAHVVAALPALGVHASESVVMAILTPVVVLAAAIAVSLRVRAHGQLD